MSLSGGESQRIRLATQIGSLLVNVLYIFDEPSIGLHPHDLENFTRILQQIKEKGNTILIVEHDPDLIKIADHIVDMGPLSGAQGGQIVYEGSFEGLKICNSKTGIYFSKRSNFNKKPRKREGFIEIKNAKLFNLDNISVKIPKNVLTVVTGVAGSGKSTLISKVLPLQLPSAKIIDQSPIVATSRANLLTYLGISDQIRNIFAKKNRVSNKIFSRNGDGACPNCKGLGIEKLDLAFMEDVQELCEVCHGSGFNNQVLKYEYNGKTIIDVMNLTTEEAKGFFVDCHFVSLHSNGNFYRLN